MDDRRTTRTGKMSRRRRREQIERAIELRDVAHLRQYATDSDGLLDSELRAKAWPILLGLKILQDGSSGSKIEKEKGKGREWQPVENGEKSEGDDDTEDRDKPTPRDSVQVKLDVERSFIGFSDTELPQIQRRQRMIQLQEVLFRVLKKHPGLHYFQGLHDIVSILLLVLGPEMDGNSTRHRVGIDEDHETLQDDDSLELVSLCTEQLCLYWIRDAMMSGLDPIFGYLRLIKRLLAVSDPTYFNLVKQTSSLPYFTISWLLTLFSHDVTSIPLISRLFDLFIAQGPSMPVYLAVAIVLERRKEIEEMVESDGGVVDSATLHTVLAKLPPIRLSEEGEEFNIPDKVSDEGLSSDAQVNVNGDADGQTTTTTPSPTTSDHSSIPPTPGPIVFSRLLSATLKINQLFPPTHDCIRVDEILGPKSALRTWPNFVQDDFGLEDAEGALKSMEDVARIPDEEDDLSSEEEEEEEGEGELVGDEYQVDNVVEDGWEKVEKLPLGSGARRQRKREEKTKLKELRRLRRRRRRRNVEMTVGTFLAVAGVAGIALALYGDPRKDATNRSRGLAWMGNAVWDAKTSIGDFLSGGLM